MLKLSDLVISAESLGQRLWLVDIVPAYAYRNNLKTDEITGYKYVTTLPDRGFEKISIKVDGRKQLEKPESGYIEVSFTDLELFVYMMNNQPQIGARATKVTQVNTKT